MTHSEIWYAIQAGGKYVHFNKDKDTLQLAQVSYEDFEAIVEIVFGVPYITTSSLDVSFVSTPIEYVALIENGAISSIMPIALAKNLYEDLTNFRAVKLTPITRCQRCDIAYIDGVFHWSYKNQPTTPEQVLAKVCIPTTGHGDKQNIPCLAKQLYESDLGLLQKTPAELHDFVRSNNNAIELELPNEDYYLEMAKELLGDRLDEQY